MSGYDSIGKRTIVLRALVAVGIVGVALLLGLLLARLTTSTPTMETIRQEQSAIGSPVKPTKETQYVRPEAPPLFFFAGVNAEGDWSLSLAEIGMAAKSGLHQFILPVRLPWRDADTIAALEVLGRVVEADPLAAFLVQVDLNPPAAWLEGHPGDQVVQNGQRLPFAAPASVAWVEEARAGWTRLLRALEDSPFAKRLIGFVPAALHEGQWHFEQPGFDTSTANAEGFREWLRGIYVEASALQQAWANPEVQFETAALPERANGGDLAHVFFDLPQQQPIVDYLNYISEVTADALAAFTTHIKNTSEAPMKVIVPYGYTFDLLNNDAGHFSLSILAGSDVDGFISPVSAVDRGSGGAGGFMGPVNTAHLHAKQWYIIDNTRTGVARDALTGAVSRLKGIRPGDVYSVQQRNFAAAAVYGLGLVWSDPAGEGWMHEEDQWVQLGRMHEIYVKLLTQAAEKKQAEEEEAEQREVAAPQEPSGPSEPEPEVAPAAPEAAPNPTEEPSVGNEAASAPTDAASAENEEPAVPPVPAEAAAPVEDATPEAVSESPVVSLPPPAAYETGLVVVVDEVSRFYQQCDVPLNEILLAGNRDAALRAGLPTQFCLLQDVLEGNSPPSPVYLFLNAFYVPADQRAVLHERLAQEQASAIWLYAPGYIDAAASVDNITATTGMHVAAFTAPEDAASTYTLGGEWMKQGESLGVSQLWQPLFYVDDPEADVLAQYKASGKTSVGVRYTEGRWTSVFVATPYLPAAMLRELLRILEQPLVFNPLRINQFDTTHVGNGLIAIHAKQIGERSIQLDRLYNIQDLLDPAIGWPKKDSFLIPLEPGETRLLQLTPP